MADPAEYALTHCGESADRAAIMGRRRAQASVSAGGRSVRPSGRREGGIGEGDVDLGECVGHSLVAVESLPLGAQFVHPVLAEHVDEKLHGRPADAGQDSTRGFEPMPLDSGNTAWAATTDCGRRPRTAPCSTADAVGLVGARQSQRRHGEDLFASNVETLPARRQHPHPRP